MTGKRCAFIRVAGMLAAWLRVDQLPFQGQLCLAHKSCIIGALFAAPCACHAVVAACDKGLFSSAGEDASAASGERPRYCRLSSRQLDRIDSYFSPPLRACGTPHLSMACEYGWRKLVGGLHGFYLQQSCLRSYALRSCCQWALALVSTS